MTNDSRTAYITGLRDLADFLDTNPAIPAPTAPLTAYYFSPQADNAVMTADIDRVAAYLGSSIDAEDARHGHYCTGIAFGPVRYEAVALLGVTWTQRNALREYLYLDSTAA